LQSNQALSGIVVDTHTEVANWWRIRDIRSVSSAESAILHNQAVLRDGIDSLKTEIQTLQSTPAPLSNGDGKHNIAVGESLESLKADIQQIQRKLQELSIAKRYAGILVPYSNLLHI
jgi:hypothetical protein